MDNIFRRGRPACLPWTSIQLVAGFHWLCSLPNAHSFGILSVKLDEAVMGNVTGISVTSSGERIVI